MGTSRARLTDIDTGILSGMKYKIVCRFKLAMDMVGSGVRDFVYDVDGPAFLKRELGMDRCWKVRVYDRTSGPVRQYADMFQVGVAPFSPF